MLILLGFTVGLESTLRRLYFCLHEKNNKSTSEKKVIVLRWVIYFRDKYVKRSSLRTSHLIQVKFTVQFVSQYSIENLSCKSQRNWKFCTATVTMRHLFSVSMKECLIHIRYIFCIYNKKECLFYARIHTLIRCWWN